MTVAIVISKKKIIISTIQANSKLEAISTQICIYVLSIWGKIFEGDFQDLEENEVILRGFQ